MIRYDPETKLIWIRANSMDEAKFVYAAHIEELPVHEGVRGIIRRGDDRVLYVIRNHAEINEFIGLKPPEILPRLTEMFERNLEQNAMKIELAIYCERTGSVCFAWIDSHLLTLWKSEAREEEDAPGAAFRLLGELIPQGVVLESLSGLWSTEFDGSQTHFFIACVEREYEIPEGLWLSPSGLNGWRLDRNMIAAFTNSPRLARLIRRNPA